MTPVQQKMIAALELCPCCKAPREDLSGDEVNGARVDFLCGSAARVNAEGYATVSIGCPYPMDDALYLIQKNLPGEAQP